ncbi:phage minor head protein [Chryseobacterium sp. T1]
MSRLIEDYLEEMFNDKNVSFVTRQKLWDFYNSKLSKAVDVGYSPDLQFYDEDLAKSLKENIAEFSAFKETAFKKDVESLLTDGKHLRKKSDFKQEALKVSDDYNYRWLETERHQTIANAQMAAKWKDFERNVELYPNIKLVSVHDARVRPEHKILDGTIRPYNDPFWKTHTPPLDWGCRCDIEQTDEEPTTIPGGFQTKIEFENNPADSGKIFGGSAYEERLNTDEKEDAIELAKYNEDIELLKTDDRWRQAFEDVKASDLLKKHPNLTIEELTTIQHYTNMGYWDLNEALYTKRVFPLEEAQERMLNRALLKLPKSKELTLMRGMPFDAEKYKKYADNIGKVINHEGFTSSTTREEIAKAFGQDEPTMMFYIKNKNGKELGDISFFSKTFGNEDEFEVLFKSNTKFNVKDIVQNGDDFEIYLEEVD